MKAIAGLFFLVAAVLADNGCPQGQLMDSEIEKLLPHKECNKFYKCAHGQPVEMQCPSILHFNEETSRCDWPSVVNCSGRELPGVSNEGEVPAGAIGIQDPNEADTSLDAANNGTDEVEIPEEPLPESTTVQSIELQENGCPVDPYIHWLTPHEDDCTLFYYCAWDTKILRQCPPYTHFNSQLQVCDYPPNAGCLNETLASR